MSLFHCRHWFLVPNFLRLVAEINIERQKKSQKGKAKSSEVKKPLSSVRVIQRNLVYIVGLPLNLGDEEVLFLLCCCVLRGHK